MRAGMVVLAGSGTSSTLTPYPSDHHLCSRLISPTDPLTSASVPQNGASAGPAGFAGGRSAGVLAHVTSVPGGRLGDGARRFVDWLAAAGASWWQVLPLGPPDEHGSPYRSASAFAGWPGLLERPDAPVSVDEEDALRARAGPLAGGVGGPRRGPGGRARPGALRPGVGCAAGPRRRAGRPAHRRRAHLRGRRQRRPPGPPGAVPRRRRRRRPARRLQRHRPALGQPALRLARPPAPPVPLVGRPPAPHLRAGRPHPHRPLPGLHRLLGGARDLAHRHRGPVGARPGSGRVRRRHGRARAAAR